jgi:hypothetical protein
MNFSNIINKIDEKEANLEIKYQEKNLLDNDKK